MPPLPLSANAPQRRLALLVGVNRYQHQQSSRCGLPPLRYAERDAEVLADFLEQGLGFTVLRLLGERATSTALLEAFELLKDMATAEPHPNSCFVFHFSGHGQQGPDNAEVGYLMLHDSDPAAPASKGIDMERFVYNLLPKVRVPNSLVLLDACHAGFAAGVTDVEIRPADQFANLTSKLFQGLRGRMVLAACAGHEQAREDATLEHGVFTYHVLKHWRDREGLSSTGSVTFGSLVDYVGRSLPMHHPGAALPVYSGVGVGGTLQLRPA